MCLRRIPRSRPGPSIDPLLAQRFQGRPEPVERRAACLRPLPPGQPARSSHLPPEDRLDFDFQGIAVIHAFRFDRGPIVTWLIAPHEGC